MAHFPLGRKTPENFDHIAAKPLSAIELVTPKPVAIGVPWYTAFDEPRQLSDGSYHLADCSRESLGTVRGGHCVCLVPAGGGVKLLEAHPQWWKFYDQGSEGACEGFGHAKAVSLEKGYTVDPWYIYDQARRLEGTYPNGEGTTNHFAAKVLETKGVPQQSGPEVATRGAHDGPVEHVTSVRWTQSTQEVLQALGRPNAAAVPVSNNWGVLYPMTVWLPVSTLDRILGEEGEADCITDA